jgi:DNA-binding CsgD family transcriptional regulator
MPRVSDRSAGMLELIGQVYDAAQNDALWDGVASDIARTSGSTGAALLKRDGDAFGVIARTANVDNDWLRRYQAHYCRLVNLSRCGPVADTQASRAGKSSPELVDFTFDEQMAATPHGLGSLIPIASGETVLLGVHRRCGTTGYDGAERDRVMRLLPHLERALRLRHRLHRNAIAANAAFDRLDRSVIATLVAGRDRRVFYANRAAEVLLRIGDGIEIVGGRIAAGSRSLTERLTRMIAAAVDCGIAGDGGSGGMLSLPRAHHLPLTALIAPLRTSEQSFAPNPSAAVVMIRDPAARPLACWPLQELFGLTAAEAAIASALAAGNSLSEIASSTRISPHTARVHLRSIFAKTCTSRQAQLVSLLLCSVAGIASSPVSVLI